jgi:small membrane protein
MLIQLILVAAIILIILRLIIQLKRQRISGGEFAGWIIIWLAAAVVILFPDITSFLAIKVGVTRGVDLVIYVSVVLVFYLLFKLLMRIEKIERDITELCRRIALDDKEKKD